MVNFTIDFNGIIRNKKKKMIGVWIMSNNEVLIDHRYTKDGLGEVSCIWDKWDFESVSEWFANNAINYNK